uniref:NADH dehydrogenase subunit 4L n=1 Tax=Branchipolynoe onnuriensis TaxID=2928633 RepID=UPI00207AB444|nr:NADH dehydrogenase subunit 4L [Branchipolynoe onnuriensis]URS74527.1 NADH dehydrogenase subunit 4L [Branchipolynoe onnuriensis]
MNMTFIPSSLIPFSIIMAITTMIIQRTHLLMTLLALEAMILNLMILIMTLSNMTSNMNLFLAMILLTFGTCEAALGLACLVKMSRTFGNDYISSSSLNSC